MENNIKSNNRVYLSGTISTKPQRTHEVCGEGFYEFMLKIPRLSGKDDLLPVTISEKLISNNISLKKGTKVDFEGQLRSHNKIEGEKSKLILSVFVQRFLSATEIKNPNQIELTGYVCKTPNFRVTPFEREICDLMISVSREFYKSDYIPAVAWGRNAHYANNLEVGQEITVLGRIQSREYQKKLNDDTVENRTAYEVSISRIQSTAKES